MNPMRDKKIIKARKVGTCDHRRSLREKPPTRYELRWRTKAMMKKMKKKQTNVLWMNSAESI